MSSVAISSLVFACVFGGALLGILLRSSLPKHHLSADSSDAVRLGMGVVVTMSALVLGLLISSAKGFYDAQSAEVTEISARIIFLDRMLAQYGPETKETRNQLRDAVLRSLHTMWPQEALGSSGVRSPSNGIETLVSRIEALSPKDERQQSLKNQTLSMAFSLGQSRWLMYEQAASSVSKPMLLILVFWLTVIFISFGLFAPRNATVTAALFFSGLSVSGAVFLILELYAPFGGVIGISSAPLRFALAHLGQ